MYNMYKLPDIFCCSVSVGNISLHFQTFPLPLIVIIQWDFCKLKESDISQSHISLSPSPSGITWIIRKQLRLNPEELYQRLQDTRRNIPEKLKYFEKF